MMLLRSIYDYTECHDIAFNMTPPNLRTLTRRWLGSRRR